MAKKNKKSTEEKKSFRYELIEQMLNLTTSGFGLVAALAWNSAIQSFVSDYIKKFFPDNYGLISQFIYAIFITILAVTLTYQLSQIAAKLKPGK